MYNINYNMYNIKQVLNTYVTTGLPAKSVLCPMICAIDPWPQVPGYIYKKKQGFWKNIGITKTTFQQKYDIFLKI